MAGTCRVCGLLDCGHSHKCKETVDFDQINALSAAVATTLARIKRFIKDPQFEELPTNIKDAISLAKSLKNDKLERNFLCLEKLISEGGDIKSDRLKIQYKKIEPLIDGISKEITHKTGPYPLMKNKPRSLIFSTTNEMAWPICTIHRGDSHKID